MTERKIPIGITLKSLLASWVTIIFGTSVMIYFFLPDKQKSYHSNQLINTLRNIWEIADEMGPVVKLSIIFIIAILVFKFQKNVIKNQLLFYLTNISFAVISVILVLALLPAEFSRGYGIGLTGTRFDIKMIPIYLTGAFLGGTVFASVHSKLLKK